MSHGVVFSPERAAHSNSQILTIYLLQITKRDYFVTEET